MPQTETRHSVLVQLDESHLEELLHRSYRRQGISFNFARLTLNWVIFYPAAVCAPFVLIIQEFNVWVACAVGLVALVGADTVIRTRKRFRQITRRWLESPGIQRLLQPTLIEVNSQTVKSTAALSSAEYAWSLVTDIERDATSAFFWLGDSQAIVVTRRAFADEHEYDCFVEMAHNYREQYTGGALKCRNCGYDLRAAAHSGCPECGWVRVQPGG